MHPNPPEFLFPDPTLDLGEPTINRRDRDDHSPALHGTAMLAKALGPEYGVSRGATAVIVRVAPPRRFQGDPYVRPGTSHMSAYTYALLKVFDDMMIHNTNPAVVSCSWGFRIGESRPRGGYLGRTGHLYQAVEQLIDIGAIVLFSGGKVKINDQPPETVSNYLHSILFIFLPY